MNNQDKEAEVVKRFSGVESHHDRNRGRGWCRYTIGDTHVWECFHNGRIHWGVADLIDNHFCNHKYRTGLFAALTLATERQ